MCIIVIPCTITDNDGYVEIYIEFIVTNMDIGKLSVACMFLPTKHSTDLLRKMVFVLPQDIT